MWECVEWNHLAQDMFWFHKGWGISWLDERVFPTPEELLFMQSVRICKIKSYKKLWGELQSSKLLLVLASTVVLRIGLHYHIFVFSRFLRVLNWGEGGSDCYWSISLYWGLILLALAHSLTRSWLYGENWSPVFLLLYIKCLIRHGPHRKHPVQ
jgi:hypothetical protein